MNLLFYEIISALDFFEDEKAPISIKTGKTIVAGMPVCKLSLKRPDANPASAKSSRNQYNAHMSPAIKRMQQAHRFFLIVSRTGFHYRAD